MHSCASANKSRDDATVAVLRELLTCFAENRNDNNCALLSALHQVDERFSKSVSLYKISSNAYANGLDSTATFLIPGIDSTHALTVDYFHNNIIDPGVNTMVTWHVMSEYLRNNDSTVFTGAAPFNISFAEIQQLLGTFEQEKFPREENSRYTFHYTGAGNNATVIVTTKFRYETNANYRHLDCHLGRTVIMI